MSSSDDDDAPIATRSGFAALDESDSDSGSASDSPAVVVAQRTVPAAAAPKSAAAPPTAAKPAPKKGGKGKAAATANDDDDDWALLNAATAQSTAPSASERATAAASTAKAATGADAAAEILARMGVGSTIGAGASASASASKKKKKKGGAAGATAGGADDVGDDAPAPAASLTTPAASKAPPAKKLTAAAKLAQERVAAVKRMEEEAAAKAAEEFRIAEELRLQEEAAQRKKDEEKARRKARDRAKKDEEIKAGTYLTKKQKEDLLKARARLALPPTGLAAAAAAEGEDEQAAAAAAAATAATLLAPQKRGVKTAAMYAATRASAKEVPAAASSAAAPSSASEAVAGAASPEAAAAVDPPAPSVRVPIAALPADPVASWEDVADDWEVAAASSSGGDGVNGSSSSSSSSYGAPGISAAAAQQPAAAAPAAPAVKLTRADRYAAAVASRSADRLRSPICVVLGHVDTGKTSLLDKIRRTNVQEGEAGGITQQIGATYFPMDRIASATDKVNRELHLEYRVPGLLIIDTPGHEQFTNLRSRGSSLCDIAVLVVDIMHGLERQTIESIALLRSKKTPFIVALNKVDRMYGWKPVAGAPIRESLATQADYAVAEFETRTAGVLTQIAEQGLNAALYYDNSDFRRVVSVVPTSATSGEGVPDLLMLIVQLTQQLMASKLVFTPFVQATILEVKAIDGLGTTVDVVLVNGELREGDTIVVCGMDGPIVTQIRALLTPPPLREMRVKGEFVHHKRIEAAMGVKISAQGLDRAVAGTSLLVAEPEDDIQELMDEVTDEFDAVMKGFKKENVGVYVQASTLGSLEALLEYLRRHSPPVPVAGVNLGPLHKKDVVSASVMHEHKKPEFATVLAFDVKVTPEAAAAAESLNVRIFTADIIYHLTDQFDAYLATAAAKKQSSTLADAVFPVILKIVPGAVFNKRDPIIVGVDVLEGRLMIGTPLCVVLDGEAKVAAAKSQALVDGDGVVVKAGPLVLDIGRVASMESDHKAIEEAPAGGSSVAVKIVPRDGAAAVMVGRQFDETALLYAHVTRESINVLKENFREKVTKAEWKTLVKLKGVLGVD